MTDFIHKCKRRRTDGPTPCLCCVGPCVGDIPRNNLFERGGDWYIRERGKDYRLLDLAPTLERDVMNDEVYMARRRAMQAIYQDAARWRALMASPRMHFMSCAGFRFDQRDGDATNKKMTNQVPVPREGEQLHFGIEFWSSWNIQDYPPHDQFERSIMTAYVDEMVKRCTS